LSYLLFIPACGSCFTYQYDL